MLASFATAHFTKQELFWLVSVFLSGVLMVVSYNVELATASGIVSLSLPYLMGINLLFFALSLLLGIFDLFDKYSISLLSAFKKR